MADATSQIEIELSGTPEDVRATLLKIRIFLEEKSLQKFEAGTLEIVLAEVLNNVVEHALTDQASGRISVSCRYHGSNWHVRVRDNGRAMPNLKLPEGNLPDASGALSDLPEGGFGWSMVHTLAHDIHYSRKNESNCLSFKLSGLST